MKVISWLLVMLPATTWATSPLPACVELVTTQSPAALQRLRFDDRGGLLSREVYGSDGKTLVSTFQFTWAPKALTVRSEWPGQSETKFQDDATGQAQRNRSKNPASATFAFGAHGELLHMTDDRDSAELTWTGSFAAAEPRPFLEGFYIGSVEHWLLPRRLDERGVFTRMQALSFTGTVSLVDKNEFRGRRDVLARYRDGKLVSVIEKDRTTALTWSGEHLVREEATRLGLRALRVDYAYTDGRLARSLMVVDADTRDVHYNYADGKLRNVVVAMSNGKESVRETIELRACK